MKPFNRRDFFSINAGLGCACGLLRQASQSNPNRVATGPLGADALYPLGSNFPITDIKTFGVTLPAPEQADRPYVFVKIETNQGVYVWGERTLEGKAAATISCIEDFKEFIIGAGPMPVEHHWQSVYVRSFYRAGPVIGSAITAIEEALWDIRDKILDQPVYKLLGGPYAPHIAEKCPEKFFIFLWPRECGYHTFITPHPALGGAANSITPPHSTL